MSVGSDHCRVTPVDENAPLKKQIEYYRHLFAYFAALNFLPGGCSVLEIGSGEGYGGSLLQQAGLHLTATDLSSQTLRHAAKTYAENRYLQALGTALPFPALSFDAVVCFQVIEHVPQDNLFAHEIHRILKSGGVLVLTTPNRKLRLLPFQKPWNPYHVREYSSAGLRKLLHNQYDRVDVYGVAGNPPIMKQLEINYQNIFFRELVRGTASSILSFFPEKTQGILRNRLKRPHEKQEPTNQRQLTNDPAGSSISQVTMNDFLLTQEPDCSLDLFAVSYKQDHP
jgi:SAM-dependent methyltransferase